jgi:RNA polymerase sigma-70 factor (ECF subfamily)
MNAPWPYAPERSLQAAPVVRALPGPNIEGSLHRHRAAAAPRLGRPAPTSDPAPSGRGSSATDPPGALPKPPVTAAERARDRELLARVARGEVEALRTLYDEHAPRAMAIATRILRSLEDAEDVVQETFVDLWRRAAQFDPSRGGAIAWVVTIARSRAIDRLRALATAGRATEEAAGEGDLAPTAFPPPHLEAERRRDRERVAQALGALPAEQRRTIELAYFEGLSQTEIASRTGSPLGTVKMRVKLAIAKLAALLKEDRG